MKLKSPMAPLLLIATCLALTISSSNNQWQQQSLLSCDATPLHCVGDKIICEETNGHCSVHCNENPSNPTTDTCSMHEAGCCKTTIYCPVTLCNYTMTKLYPKTYIIHTGRFGMSNPLWFQL